MIHVLRFCYQSLYKWKDNTDKHKLHIINKHRYFKRPVDIFTKLLFFYFTNFVLAKLFVRSFVKMPTESIHCAASVKTFSKRYM